MIDIGVAVMIDGFTLDVLCFGDLLWGFICLQVWVDDLSVMVLVWILPWVCFDMI